MASKGKLVNKGGSSRALPRVDSSAPTAMIAPEDYEHLYAAGKGKEKVVKVVKEVKGQSDSLSAAGASDAPTALIAPQDYAHIFCAEPTIKKKILPKNGSGAKDDKRIPSDAPTALIEAVTKQNAKSSVGKPAAKDTKGKGKPKAGGRSHSSTKPTASKAASSSSRKESSSKHENDDGDEEGSGCACLIL